MSCWYDHGCTDLAIGLCAGMVRSIASFHSSEWSLCQKKLVVCGCRTFYWPHHSWP